MSLRRRVPIFGFLRVIAGLALCAGVFPGCATPNADNIRLRKLNQDLNAQVAELTQQKEAEARTVAGLQSRSPTIPMLPPEEFANLWVTSGITFGQFTGASKLDAETPGAVGLKVYVTPRSDTGQAIQAAGSVVIEAFDLSLKTDNRIGRWSWNAHDAKSQWRSFVFESGYELTCPLASWPQHPNVTIRATFTDELTHIPYVAEKLVQVELPVSSISTPAPTPAASK